MARFSYADATHCRRGHDLALPGATEPDRKGGKTKRCAECRREKDRARLAAKRKERGEFCRNGHSLTGTNLQIVIRAGQNVRFCNACRKMTAKHDSPGRERDITRLILWLDEQRERAATWWEREVFVRRKAVLLGVENP